MDDYIYIIRPCRPGFIDNMSPEEEYIIDRHFEYLKSNMEQGRLTLAGPCTDGDFGVVIFKAQSIDKAEDFMKHDPAVESNIMCAELHPFRVSLLCRGR